MVLCHHASQSVEIGQELERLEEDGQDNNVHKDKNIKQPNNTHTTLIYECTILHSKFVSILWSTKLTKVS